MGEAGEDALYNLSNDVLKNSTIPSDWNTGIIMPLYKKKFLDRQK